MKLSLTLIPLYDLYRITAWSGCSVSIQHKNSLLLFIIVILQLLIHYLINMHPANSCVCKKCLSFAVKIKIPASSRSSLQETVKTLPLVSTGGRQDEHKASFFFCSCFDEQNVNSVIISSPPCWRRVRWSELRRKRTTSWNLLCSR